MSVRSALRALAAVLAAGLIIYGIAQPVERDVTWLICLWAAAPLMGLVAWFSQPETPPGLARSVSNLGLIVLIGFVLLSLQLLRQQFVSANLIYNHVAYAADGSTTSNVRPVIASQRILRGRIIDRNGVVLVDSESVEGFARRIYPLASLYDPTAFSHIVGFFSPRYGQSGLERSYAEWLTGDRGSEWDRLREEWLGSQRRGNDLKLTLNADLQARAAAAIGGRVGSAVVLDPRTGAVLAMVSRPGYDPGQLAFNPAAPDRDAENLRAGQYWEFLNSDGSGQPLLNRAAQGLYPPGSTYKTVTAVGVLEHPEPGGPDTIICPEVYHPQPDAPPVVNSVSGLASLTGDPSNLERVYAYSCNTAFAQYATRLGADLMAETAARFDIFRPQDAPATYGAFGDLPTAASLLYVDPGFLNQPRALADTGYGQGQLLVTPLQMAMVAAAIANDGVLMRPYLVQEITRPDGELIRQPGPQPIRRAMSERTAQTMLKNMAAVAQYGFGRSVSDWVPGIPVGGKSGTAEHVPGATPHAWFIAVAPLDNPRFAVAVMLESGGEGSGAGAELAGQILAAAFATEQ